MNVTGFLLREAIKRWELRRDTAASQFDGSLYKFEKETKAKPDDLFNDFSIAEDAIAQLETAQTKYNLKVQVDVFGKKMSLCEAVKRLGGAARGEKMWRSATNPKKDRYAYMSEPTERDPTKERAAYVLTKNEMMNRANKESAYSGAVRAAIASGNGTQVACEDIGLAPSLVKE